MNKKKLAVFLLVLISIPLSSILMKEYGGRIGKFFSNNSYGDTNRVCNTKGTTSQSTTKPNSTGSSADRAPVKKEPPVVASAQLPSSFNLKWQLFKEGTQINDFNRGYQVNLPGSGDYSKLPGITTFRGNNYRDSASFGNAGIRLEKLEKLWWARTDYIDTWTGVGWNGQPAIVMWDDETRSIMNLYPKMKQKSGLKEVIYATLDGKIYFLDLETGEPTRDPINVGAPLKGSVTVDPRGYPLLYAGQGINTVGGNYVDIGYRVYSLINGKMLHFINGIDPAAYRQWGAFDANPVIDADTDSLFLCGENGLFYSVKLNTKYEPANKSISIKPETVKYRYKADNRKNTGSENSLAVYKNYAFFADNGGLLQCVDLNTMKPVWVRDVTDDTDSTIAVEVEGEYDVSLYTACEVDIRQQSDNAYIRKINALNGDLIWEKAYKCRFDSWTNGGVMASPVVGKHDISDLVIYNIAMTGSKNYTGKLVALDKKTGDEKWVLDLDYYCWSSPVAVYTKEGKSYLLVCDSGGYMMLIDGKTGKILNKTELEGNVEGSPAVFDDIAVVGTRGQKIWGVRLK